MLRILLKQIINILFKKKLQKNGLEEHENP